MLNIHEEIIEKTEGKWERMKYVEWEGIEEEWEVIRDSMNICAEEVCSRKKVGRMKALKIKGEKRGEIF